MIDELLPYYNQQLSLLRRQITQFSNRHENISLNDDPLIEQLIQSFAFLAARIQYKLDDNSQISSTLLDILYPDYQQLIPSMAVLQFQPQDTLQSAYTIPAETELVCHTLKNKPCRFRTTYPVTLHPLSITEASINPLSISKPFKYLNYHPKSSLTIKLKCFNSDTRILDLGINILRFYINTAKEFTYLTYELLFNHCSYITLENPDIPSQKQIIPTKHLSPVGFSEKDTLLPHSNYTFLGFQLLKDFFSFPEKFLFFDLYLGDHLSSFDSTHELSINFYFDIHSATLENAITRNSFVLACTPIINLFETVADPIQLDHTQHEYHIIPDRHSPIESYEIHSIIDVTASNQANDSIAFYPFYTTNHHYSSSEPLNYWQAHRKPSCEVGKTNISGDEMFLSFITSKDKAFTDDKWFVNMRLLCCNRDLPYHLGSNPNTIELSFWNSSHEQVAAIRCLTTPTPTLRPALSKSNFWSLISHLSLTHLSLNHSQNSNNSIVNLLKLYNFQDRAEINAFIEGITNINTQSITARHPSVSHSGLCRGIKIIIEYSSTKLAHKELFLFGSIMAKFFSYYCSINSFTQLVLKNIKNDEVIQWEPAIGQKALL